MSEHDELAERFEAQRGHLRAVAYRILGSWSEAEDAVQESWLRLARVDISGVDNLGGWLTTVVSRICFDLLRARASRGEDGAERSASGEVSGLAQRGDPEQEALLLDSVGRALLVVLNTLAPAERVAFVLHDTFGVPFNEIGPIVGRSAAAAKKLASRARHKVRGRPAIRGAQCARHRRVVEAFLAASRAGDLQAVIAVLAPDVVRRADRAALPSGRATEVRGAQAVADEIVVFGRNARFAEPVLINGVPGLVVAPAGRLLVALAFVIEGEKILGYELIADVAKLRRLELAVLDK